jgi:hypothetical protein
MNIFEIIRQVITKIINRSTRKRTRSRSGPISPNAGNWSGEKRKKPTPEQTPSAIPSYKEGKTATLPHTTAKSSLASDLISKNQEPDENETTQAEVLQPIQDVHFNKENQQEENPINIVSIETPPENENKDSNTIQLDPQDNQSSENTDLGLAQILPTSELGEKNSDYDIQIDLDTPLEKDAFTSNEWEADKDGQGVQVDFIEPPVGLIKTNNSPEDKSPHAPLSEQQVRTDVIISETQPAHTAFSELQEIQQMPAETKAEHFEMEEEWVMPDVNGDAGNLSNQEIPEPVIEVDPHDDASQCQLFIQEIETMKLGSYKGQRKRHKPLLLLAVLSLIDTGEIRSNRVYLNTNLEKRFASFFNAVKREYDWCQIALPFLHLHTSPFWSHQIIVGNENSYLATKNMGTNKKKVLEHIEYAYFPELYSMMLHQAENRETIRQAILEFFFTGDEKQKLQQIDVAQEDMSLENQPGEEQIAQPPSEAYELNKNINRALEESLPTPALIGDSLESNVVVDDADLLDEVSSVIANEWESEEQEILEGIPEPPVKPKKPRSIHKSPSPTPTEARYFKQFRYQRSASGQLSDETIDAFLRDLEEDNMEMIRSWRLSTYAETAPIAKGLRTTGSRALRGSGKAPICPSSQSNKSGNCSP